MKTVSMQASLLAFGLAANAGGALAQDCPSDPGNRASTPATAAMPYRTMENFVYADPLADLLRVQAAMAREFNAINALNAMWMPVMLAPPVNFSLPAQAAALQRTKDGYQLQVKVPGFKPEDIHVQLNGQVLSVSAQDSSRETSKVGNGPVQTLSTRSFVQMLTLPESVETTGLKQSVQNGILTITIPDAQGAPGHT